MLPEGPLRVGIVGGGFMGAVHSRAARAAGASLVAIASSSPARAREAATALGAGASFDSAEDLIRHADVDVVHICTPNATHEELTILALESGRHVVCEKPLAIDSEASVALARRAADAGVTATVPFVYRYHPMVREARARVQGGETGRVIHVTAAYLQDWLQDDTDSNWRVARESGGASRAFADIGSHLVDLTEFITGQRIEALCAVTSHAYEHRAGVPVTTEDVAQLLVRFSSGTHGSMVVSQVAAGHKNDLRVEVFGTAASILFEQERPDTLVIGRRSGTSIISREATVLGTDAERLSLVPAGHPMGYQDAFNAFVRDTYSQIRTAGDAVAPSFADGARAALITDAVLESSRTGSWVEVRDAISALPVHA